MNRSLTARIMDLLQRRQLKGTLAKIGLTLSCMSIFMITYMLVAPVLTQEWEAVCGMEEHTHTDSCYADVLTCGLEEVEAVVTDHEHDEGCYELRTEDILICGQEVGDGGHTHSDSCYTGGETTLICTEPTGGHEHSESCYSGGEAVLTCTEPTGGHEHDDSCYTVETITKYKTVIEEITEMVTVEDTETVDITDEEGNVIGSETVVTGSHEEEQVVGTQEIEVEDGTEEIRTLTCTEPTGGHEHDDSCYTIEGGTLTCTEPTGGHEHDDSCYVTEGQTLTCAEEESEGHQHDDSCYEQQETEILICTEGGTPGHAHSDECYEHRLICELEEHTHIDLCYQKPEGEPKYTCGFLTEHIHLEHCYFEDGELKCSIPEHVHTDECLFEIVTLDETFTAESEDGAVILNLHVNGEVALPESETEDVEIDETEDAEINEAEDAETGFQLVLTESEDMDAYEEYEALASEQGDVLMVQVLNYTLTYNGLEVDLSACEVTAEVTPTEAFEEMLNTPAEEFEEMLSTLALAEVPEEETLDDPDVPMAAAFDLDHAEGGEEDDTAKIKFVAYTEEQPGMVAYAVMRKVNPDFTVQFYANLNVPESTENTEGEIIKGTIPFISTKGGKLPINGDKNLPLINLGIDAEGAVKFNKKLTQVYKTETKEFNPRLEDELDINYLNSLRDNDHYTVKELWVLKEGKKSDSTNKEEDWDVYPVMNNAAQVAFTNNEELAGKKDENRREYIVVKEGTVMRLVYDIAKGSDTFSSLFFDYDITTGLIYRAKPNDPLTYTNYKTAGETFSGDSLTNEVLTWAAGLSEWDKHLYAYTKESGINSSGNYTGSGTKLAFGNVNTGTNLGKLLWDGNALNQYNAPSRGGKDSYEGCTFGIARSLDSNGNIQYASGINAPKLFNEGSATGKTTYGDYSLNFKRVGDTYTLTAVSGTGATGLDTFNNPTNSTGTHTSIWTNNFWPMDSAPSFGTNGHDVKFGGTATFKGAEHEIRFGPITQKGTDYTFPESDDGLYHNSYFGMTYGVNFDLIEEYVGPLEYYFYGDDDMWVFLDGRLVCDIGGVHSSVGEYVDLWDYIEGGREGHTKNQHTLNVFYTERGASGSTCWMQFTLPQISKIYNTPYDPTTAGLTISKTSEGAVRDVEQEFPFELTLGRIYNDYEFKFKNAEDKEITKELINTKNNRKVETVSAGTYSFTLKSGERLEIIGLPEGTFYYIEEKYTDANCTTTTSIDGKEPMSGVLVEGDIQLPVTVAYTNTFQYALPSTGGAGTTLLYAAGMTLFLTGLCLMYETQRRSRKAERGETA